MSSSSCRSNINNLFVLLTLLGLLPCRLFNRLSYLLRAASDNFPTCFLFLLTLGITRMMVFFFDGLEGDMALILSNSLSNIVPRSLARNFFLGSSFISKLLNFQSSMCESKLIYHPFTDSTCKNKTQGNKACQFKNISVQLLDYPKVKQKRTHIYWIPIPNCFLLFHQLRFHFDICIYFYLIQLLT